MTPTRETILRTLPAFKDQWVVLKDEQGVNDIVREIEKSHKLFSGYYDNFALYFADGSIDEICDRLYKFCKKNIRYQEEPEETQTSKLPSAMLVEGHGDCKHYSSFCAGVLDALRRQGYKINWCYRFASYKAFDKDPHHVFVVVNDRGREIWIDPTPGAETRTPIWILDKKFYCPMALIRNIAGVGATQVDWSRLPVYINGQWYMRNSDNTVGSFDLGEAFSTTIDNFATGAGGAADLASGDFGGVIQAGTSIINNISSLFGSIFGGSKECNAYQTLVALFPVTNQKDPNSIMSALTGLYNHYKVEKWVVDRSVTATRCWPEGYEQYFKELISQYNTLVGAQVLTWSKNPPTERNGIQSINVDQNQVNKANMTSSSTGIPTSGGFINWVKANPLLAAGGAVGIFFVAKMLMKKSHKTAGVSGKEKTMLPLLAVAAVLFFVLKKKTATTTTPKSSVIVDNPIVQTEQQFVNDQTPVDTTQTGVAALDNPMLGVRTVDPTYYEKPLLVKSDEQLLMMPPVYYGGAEVDYGNSAGNISMLAV